MSKVAFELRADAADFSGGSVSLPGGEAFDVGDALKEGGGKITLNPDAAERKGDDAQEKENERAAAESQIVEALDQYPALKRVAAGGAAASTSEGGDGGAKS